MTAGRGEGGELWRWQGVGRRRSERQGRVHRVDRRRNWVLAVAATTCGPPGMAANPALHASRKWHAGGQTQAACKNRLQRSTRQAIHPPSRQPATVQSSSHGCTRRLAPPCPRSPLPPLVHPGSPSLLSLSAWPAPAGRQSNPAAHPRRLHTGVECRAGVTVRQVGAAYGGYTACSCRQCMGTPLVHIYEGGYS